MAEETILGQIGAKTFEKIPKDIQRPISKETKAGQEQLTQNVNAPYTAPDVFVDKEANNINYYLSMQFTILSLVVVFISILVYFRLNRLKKKER